MALAYFWISHHYYIHWSLYDSSVKKMSNISLERLKNNWTRGAGYQDKGQLYYVRNEKDKSKKIYGLNRYLEILIELLKRLNSNHEKSQIEYVNTYKQ